MLCDSRHIFRHILNIYSSYPPPFVFKLIQIADISIQYFLILVNAKLWISHISLFFFINLLCFYNVIDIPTEKEKKEKKPWIFEAVQDAGWKECFKKQKKKRKKENNRLSGYFLHQCLLKNLGFQFKIG